MVRQTFFFAGKTKKSESAAFCKKKKGFHHGITSWRLLEEIRSWIFGHIYWSAFFMNWRSHFISCAPWQQLEEKKRKKKKTEKGRTRRDLRRRVTPGECETRHKASQSNTFLFLLICPGGGMHFAAHSQCIFRLWFRGISLIPSYLTCVKRHGSLGYCSAFFHY